MEHSHDSRVKALLEAIRAVQDSKNLLKIRYDFGRCTKDEYYETYADLQRKEDYLVTQMKSHSDLDNVEKRVN